MLGYLLEPTGVLNHMLGVTKVPEGVLIEEIVDVAGFTEGSCVV